MLDRDELSYLLDVSGELGGRLGPMLLQLPPNLKSDVGRPRDFVSLSSMKTRAPVPRSRSGLRPTYRPLPNYRLRRTI